MNTQVTTPWQGNWQLRLQFKLESLGYASLEEFLQAHPGLGYLKVAELLSDANIAAMQLYGEQIRAAAHQGRLREVAADSLSRFLAQHVNRGWGRGKHFQLRVASAFGDWKTVIRQFSDSGDVLDQQLNAVSEAIKGSNPPVGWIPKSGDDELLQKAFDEGWQI